MNIREKSEKAEEEVFPKPRTICQQCCRSDNWDWKCDHDSEKWVQIVISLVLQIGDPDSELHMKGMKCDLGMFGLTETSNFDPPSCGECGKDDGWFCAEWLTYPDEDHKSVHWCLCGDRTNTPFPANLTPCLVSPNPTKTFIRPDFCGTYPDLDRVLHTMRFSEFLCDYPECDTRIKILRYYTNSTKAEMLKDGVKVMLGPSIYNASGLMDPSRKTELVFMYLLEGSCRITDSGCGPYHRLDFCEEHKEEGNLASKTLIVMDYRDISPIDSDHVLRYQAEMRKQMTPGHRDP